MNTYARVIRSIVVVCASLSMTVLAILAAEPATNSWKEISTRADRAFETWGYGEALQLYQQIPPENMDAESLVRIGDCFYHLGQFEDARKVYEGCLAKFPRGSGRTFVYAHLADCYVTLGRLEEARQLYQRAQKLYQIEFDVEARIRRLKITGR